MRSGDPANVTRTPRALSSSATASDGSTWPPVPPAAIRHLDSSFRSLIPSDVKEDADRREDHEDARTTVGHERQRDTCERRDPHDGRAVERRLAADEHRQPGCEVLPEGVAAAERDAQAR